MLTLLRLNDCDCKLSCSGLNTFWDTFQTYEFYEFLFCPPSESAPSPSSRSPVRESPFSDRTTLRGLFLVQRVQRATKNTKNTKNTRLINSYGKAQLLCAETMFAGVSRVSMFQHLSCCQGFDPGPLRGRTDWKAAPLTGSTTTRALARCVAGGLHFSMLSCAKPASDVARDVRLEETRPRR